MPDLKVREGERLVLAFRGGSVVRVTPRMYEAVARARDELIEVAAAGGTMTYGELARAIEGAYLPRGMGRMLDVLSEDCFRRGEPSLASLVVQKDSGEVGSAFVGQAQAERERCYAYWRHR